MKFVSVVGNGESRLKFNVNKLDWLGPVIGANAIFRDYYSDELVCCDRRMVQEAVNHGYNNTIYTRENWYKQFSYWPNVTKLPDLPYTGDKRQDDPWHWGSGGHALNLACTKNPEIIIMLGFDLWGTNSKFNNVYKNSDNYNSSDKPATDPSYWIYQLAKLFKHYPNIKFIQIQPEDWQMPSEWESYENLFVDSFDALDNLVASNK